MSGHYGFDATIGVELQLVDAGLTMPAGTFAPVEVVLVDAMVYDVPLVFTWELQHAIVGRTVDLVFGALDEDDGLGSNLDGAEG